MLFKVGSHIFAKFFKFFFILFFLPFILFLRYFILSSLKILSSVFWLDKSNIYGLVYFPLPQTPHRMITTISKEIAQQKNGLDDQMRGKPQ